MEQGGRGHNLATVATVDPVCMVATSKDLKASVPEEAPWYGRVGPDGEGDFSSPQPGWRGLIDRESGQTMMSAFLPSPNLFSADPLKDDYNQIVNTWLNLTGTNKDYRTHKAQSRNFRAQRPADTIAGDQGFRSSEGALYGALRGGVAFMKASDLAQIQVNQVDDLLRMMGRNVDMFSDWGSMQITNEGGKTRMVLKGNAVADQTYKDAYAYEFSVGAGEHFLSLAIKDKANAKDVFTLSIDQKGGMHVFQAGDRIEQIHGNVGMGITGDEKRIVAGKASLEADGGYLIKAPHVDVGGAGGQRTPLGENLVAFLKQLVYHMNNEMMLQVISPGLPTKPGAVFAMSDVPDNLLSGIVKNV